MGGAGGGTAWTAIGATGGVTTVRPASIPNAPGNGGACGSRRNRSRAAATSPADAKRCAGSRASALATMASMPAGTSGRIDDGAGGSDDRRATATAAAELPDQARRPVSISHSTRPRE